MTHTDPHIHRAFGGDTFGVLAERFARFFGTPKFIIGQTIIVALWISLNAFAISNGWDPYPFILLNLLFSTQAAYAAPLILLAQTRQADRDSVQAKKDEEDRLRHALETQQELKINTDLTETIHTISKEIHAAVVAKNTSQ